MLRGSAELERVLEGSYRAAVMCEAWLTGRRIATDLPLVSGSISVDASNFVRRTASLTFAEDESGSVDRLADVLARPGCEIRVWRGAYVGEYADYIPAHWGLAENPKLETRTRQISVTSPDLSMRVSLDRFPRPRTSSTGLTVPQQIASLVRETLPGVPFQDDSRSGVVVAPVTWERDRNAAITDLATSIGCETFLRPDGKWVLRPVENMLGLAQYRVREGLNLVNAGVETDWSGVRNHIVVSADNADGAALWGESLDDDPESPTYIHGPLRRRTGFYSSSLFTTSVQCTQAARALRARMEGAQVSVSYESLQHPGVEAGDRHDVTLDSKAHRIVLDSFSFDIFSGTMQGAGRTARQVAGVD